MATNNVLVRTNQEPSKVKYANPFSAFRHEMDGLFDTFFSSRPAFDFRLPLSEDFPKSLKSKKCMIVPEIDIFESKKNITLKAELPGLSKDAVELTVRDGILTLQGEKKFEWKEKEDNIHVMECRYGTFQRSFTPPSSVDQNTIKAKFNNGVLTVFMPKLEKHETSKKSIRIN